jgi:prolyl 4-hydroxylase
MFRYVIASFLLAGLLVQAQDANYGVDCSFPIHSKEFRCGNLLGDRKKIYDDFMEGCRKFYGNKGKRCDSTEQDRLEMSLRQPQSMVVRDTRIIVRLVSGFNFTDF